MATVGEIRTPTAGRTFHVIWEELTSANEVGSAVSIPGASDRSVTVLGTIGAAAVLIEGSNVLVPSSDADWVTLNDEAGDLLSFAATGLGHALSENTLHVRPRLTGADGSSDIDVIMLFRSTMS